MPAIEVRFYPYAGLRHTIRLRSGRVYVRSRIFVKTRRPTCCVRLRFWRALLGKRVPTIHDRVYRDYSLTPTVMRSSDLARRGRGRKMISTAQGEVYDLDRMFAKLNRRYSTARYRSRRSRGHSVGRGAFSVITTTSTTASRSARHWIRKTFRSGQRVHPLPRDAAYQAPARLINGRR